MMIDCFRHRFWLLRAWRLPRARPIRSEIGIGYLRRVGISADAVLVEPPAENDWRGGGGGSRSEDNNTTGRFLNPALHLGRGSGLKDGDDAAQGGD